MIKTIALIIVAALALALATILILAAMKPDGFRVQRTTTIKVSPETIYPLITDLRGWAAWSPYEKKDPAMKRSFSGAARGTGAIYEWDGDKNVGKGRMEIIDAVPSSKIVIKLDFLAPFEAHNTAEFTLTEAAGATNVTWAMYGPQPFVSKIMGVVFNLDRMIGTDFEAGLVNLKARAERDAAPSAPAIP